MSNDSPCAPLLPLRQQQMQHQHPQRYQAAAPVLSTPDTRIFEHQENAFRNAKGGALAPSPSSEQNLSDEQFCILYEIERTVREIRAARWKKIALQFPDDMLADAPRVYRLLARRLASERKRYAPKEKEKGKGKEEKEEEGEGEDMSDFRVGDDGNGHGCACGRERSDGHAEADSNTQSNGNCGNAAAVAATVSGASPAGHEDSEKIEEMRKEEEAEELFILGDTAYGACCVDEIAAEHVEAQVVVHYGRSCLSPTARLPVIYVFTKRPLSLPRVVEAILQTYPNRKASKIILMADVAYAHHLPTLSEILRRDDDKEKSFGNVFATAIRHDPSSLIPNRTVPDAVVESENAEEELKSWSLFHISEPPQSLLLTLSSRVSVSYVYPVDKDGNGSQNVSSQAASTTTAALLRRRYALLASLKTASIFGILINTLSVKNYLHILGHVKAQITAAGKKFYTFVVGKVNAAKVANFSEVDGWVVIGCWESSLIDSKDFWKPIITPFELRLAFQSDAERVWTGEWTSNFEAVLADKAKSLGQSSSGHEVSSAQDAQNGDDDDDHGDHGARTGVNGSRKRVEISIDKENYSDEDEEESMPPEFDLRTGRYVSHTRPLMSKTVGNGINNSTTITKSTSEKSNSESKSLVTRHKGEIAQIGGIASPGAEFLRNTRTWQGLGSDFSRRREEDEEGRGGDDVGDDDGGAVMGRGRSGVAKGYTLVGDNTITKS